MHNLKRSKNYSCEEFTRLIAVAEFGGLIQGYPENIASKLNNYRVSE